MTWIFLIDRSYGYRPLRRVTSDLLRTAVSLGPAVLFVYWFIGFHDARDLRNDIGSIAISTRAGATMDIDSYRNFETWLLAKTGGRDSTQFTWIPVRAAEGVTLRSAEQRVPEASALIPD